MEDQIKILREQAEIRVGNHPSTGFRPATPKQASLLAAEMERVLGSNRELRLAVLREIFPFGVRPVESTYHLSVAEASVLIRFLYGLDEDERVPPQATVQPEAETLLCQLKQRTQFKERQALIDQGQLEMEMK